MVVLVENPPSDFNWRRQIVFGVVGLAVSLGLTIVFRRTSLSSAAIYFLSSLPLFFLLTLGSPMAGPQLRTRVRVARAVAYAILVSAVLYLIMRAAS